MIKDEKKWQQLYDAAERIYKWCDKQHGFRAGTKKLADGKEIPRWNQFSGARAHLELKMGRKLDLFEQTALAIAVGDHTAECLKKTLTVQEKIDIFQDLWDGKPNYDRVCLTFEHLVTNI